MLTGIYAIECTVTHQIYVGSAVSIPHRIQTHLMRLQKGKHKNKLMQESYIKYGEEKFDYYILEECEKEIILDREGWWVLELDTINTGFNTAQLGSNGMLTHGLTNTPTFRSWGSMKQRCTNPNAPDYPRYGGVGITVCERWLTFDNFYKDMGDRPIGTSLDRYPNKFGNYEPGNCRWATASEQQKNKTNSIYVIYKGIERPLVEWADEKGIPRDLLRRRFLAGMVDDELFASSYSRFEGVPGVKKRKRMETRHDLRRFEYDGKMMTITEVSELTGFPRQLLSQRLKRDGMSVDKALTPNRIKGDNSGPRKGHHMITAFGKTQSLTAWAREKNMSVSTLKNRIYRAGLLPEDALK